MWGRVVAAVAVGAVVGVVWERLAPGRSVGIYADGGGAVDELGVRAVAGVRAGVSIGRRGGE
jgi:hypothetical protein